MSHALVNIIEAECRAAKGKKVQAPALTIGGSSCGSYTVADARTATYTKEEECAELIANARKQINDSYGRHFKKNPEEAKKVLWPVVKESYERLDRLEAEFCPRGDDE